ncbi:MAG: DNA polymerase IV [Firmicutes bacterium]|nr:DNA polymerase IV [Bacillota bacterium]
MPPEVNKIIMLVDMESFYASVEVAKNPSLRGKPVVVCGDPKQRSGIVLAATREAKTLGVKTGMTAGECTRLSSQLVFVRPHMQDYIDTSLKITKILEKFTDRIRPYSIDEQFLDMTGCEKLFGNPKEMAKLIIKKVWESTGIRCRVGIGENPLQAKMACDRFAKKNKDGFFILSHKNYAIYTWPLPIKDLFGVGSRMENNFFNIGIRTIGHLAVLPRESLKRRWGINGEILWLNARGIDYSIIEETSRAKEIRKSVSHSITLPRDYRVKKEIEVVLLEITEEVCRRARSIKKAGRVVHVCCRGADFELATGFSRQVRTFEPTAITMDVYSYALKLFYTYWDRRPIRALGISLSDLTDFKGAQLSLINRKEKEIALTKAMDLARSRYGITSLFWLSSLAPGGLLFERATKIGGHEA